MWDLSGVPLYGGTLIARHTLATVPLFDGEAGGDDPALHAGWRGEQGVGRTGYRE